MILRRAALNLKQPHVKQYERFLFFVKFIGTRVHLCPISVYPNDLEQQYFSSVVTHSNFLLFLLKNCFSIQSQNETRDDPKRNTDMSSLHFMLLIFVLFDERISTLSKFKNDLQHKDLIFLSE